jgi:hypothetical protein
MLPTAYIPVSVANKMLFIGRAVCILQHPSADSDAHGLLPHSEVVEAAQSLHQLRETEHFDLMKVEFEVDRIRAKVSRYLWDLVVLKSDLQGHLLALKDYFLLGRGEFFQCFLDEAAVMMGRPPGSRAARDIHNGPFQTAATKLGLDESPYFKRLSFQMDEASFDFQGFTEADLPKSTVKSGLICLGSASLIGPVLQLAGHTASQAGAVWFTPRQVVEKGFETTFSVQVKANTHIAVNDSKFREGFAFVLQSNGMQSLPVKMANPANSAEAPLVSAPPPLLSLVPPSFFVFHTTP